MRQLLCAALLMTCAAARPARNDQADHGPVVTPVAVAQTTPVPHGGDSADDPAIWIHPADPQRSLIIGTDKHGGLIVYDLDGKQLQIVSDRAWPDNVDVLYNFPLAEGKIDLAVAGCREPKSLGLKLWKIDPETRGLSDVTAGNAIPVFGHHEPYGTGVYHSPKSGKFYVFVNNKQGAQEQYELINAGGGKVGALKVRSFKLPSITEGCVCDDELGFVYIAEEKRGIWKFPAEPDGGNEGKLIVKTGEHGLVADVEGLTLYCGQNGKGYLIASSQGNSSFKVYERSGTHSFVCTIKPRSGAIRATRDTDGIAVTNRPTSAQFAKGLFVAQDGSGPHQNFKLYRWEDIAQDRLMIDTGWDPRK